MALQFDLVSPERRLASLQASEVQIPGADGVLRVVATSGTTAYVVTGGFAEITAAGVSVLAERAVPLDEANGALFDALIAEAREAAATTDDKDVADKLIADMMAARAAAGQ
jgi:F-type H+-transporting ATPase subunit epsilon